MRSVCATAQSVGSPRATRHGRRCRPSSRRPCRDFPGKARVGAVRAGRVGAGGEQTRPDVTTCAPSEAQRGVFGVRRGCSLSLAGQAKGLLHKQGRGSRVPGRASSRAPREQAEAAGVQRYGEIPPYSPIGFYNL